MNKRSILFFIIFFIPLAYAAIPDFSISTNNNWAGSTNSIYDVSIVDFENTSSDKFIDVSIPKGYELYVPPVPAYVVADVNIDIWNGTNYVSNQQSNVTVFNQT